MRSPRSGNYRCSTVNVTHFGNTFSLTVVYTLALQIKLKRFLWPWNLPSARSVPLVCICSGWRGRSVTHTDAVLAINFGFFGNNIYIYTHTTPPISLYLSVCLSLLSIMLKRYLLLASINPLTVPNVWPIPWHCNSVWVLFSSSMPLLLYFKNSYAYNYPFLLFFHTCLCYYKIQ